MSTDRTASSLGTRWMCVLVSLLGAFEVLMALGAGSALTCTVGVIGGLALAAAPWLARRMRVVALGLLAVGTVPFAVLTVTSLVAPLLAVVAWILMALVLREITRSEASAPSTDVRSASTAGTATA